MEITILKKEKICERCNSQTKNFIDSSFSACRECLTNDEIYDYILGPWRGAFKGATKSMKKSAFKKILGEYREKRREEDRVLDNLREAEMRKNNG